MSHLTRATLKARCGRALGWVKDSSWPTGLDFPTFADEFGEFLLAVETPPWNFTIGQILKLTITAGVGEYVLDPSFRSLDRILPASLGGPCYRIGSLGEVADARAGVAVDRVAALRFADATQETPYQTPILELGPTPQTTITNGLQLIHRRGWSPLTKDTSVIPLPIWMQGLYVQGLILYLRGAEYTAGGSLTEALQELMESPLYAAARNQDGWSSVNEGLVNPTSTKLGTSFQGLPITQIRDIQIGN